MSAAQQRLFAIDQLQEQNTTYNVPIIMKVENQLDIERLTRVINQLCERHEILRTNFSVMDGKMVQMVSSERTIEIDYMKGEENQIEQVIGHFVKSFDLTKDPLLRVCLFEYAPNESLLMFDFHHIIFDGESMYPFFSDLVKLYNEETLPDLKLQYRNFSSWHNKLDISSQKEYWLNELSGDLPVTEIPTDYTRPKEKVYTGKSLTTEFDRESYQKVKQLALKFETTEYVILFTIFMVLLSKYSNNREVMVGSPVSGRTHPDVQEMIGMFVNTVVIRETFEKDDTFRDAVKKVKEKFLTAYENQDYAFDALVEDLDIKRDSSRNPLFDYTFVYQKGNTETLQLGEAILSDYPLEPSVSKFDLTLTASDIGENYLFNLEYCSELFEPHTIERFAKHYMNLIHSTLKDDSQLIDKLSYIDNEEYRQLVSQRDQISYPVSKMNSIIEQFESIVEKNPNQYALCLQGQKLTYGELNEKANSVGAKLRAEGIGREDIVALVMDRSFEMILGILGILKAGAAFLPIAEDAPLSRIEFILADSQAKMIITDQKNESTVSLLKNKAVYVLKESETSKIENLSKINQPEDLAYIIYTSGTTGNPKGVMIENRNALNLFDWLIPFSEVSSNSVILQKATYTFDAFVFELFWALLSGVRLQLLTSEENKDYSHLLRVIKENKVTHAIMIPTMFSSLLDFIRVKGYAHEFASLEKIYFGGEALTKNLVENYRNLVGSDACHLGNLYGPTETTICATGFMIPEKIESENIPIGTTVNNVHAYIMSNGELCGIGVPGELCISGKNNARGYLNLPEMTKENFSVDPFDPEGTLYHTGDLARWRSDGQLECLGRIDEQVKIRGFRIELSEIETRLKEISAVQDATVIAKKITDATDDLQLCAYIVVSSELEITQIKERLKQELPDYMVPPYIMIVDEIPITKNGKVDKANLPLPKIQELRTYILPSTETEKRILAIFQEVLGIDKISIHDSFFELGGHSIKAMKLASLLQKEFEIPVSLRDILEQETIAKIAQRLDQKEKVTKNGITKATNDFDEMSSVQKRIFAIEQSTPSNTNYNMPFFMEVIGTIDLSKLNNAFNQLIHRHESLRTTFDVVDGNFHQYVQEKLEITIEQYSVNKEEIDSVTEAFVQPFDLINGPLIRVGFINTESDMAILMIDLHHIIFDGFSLSLFFDELIKFYDETTLAPLTLQYKDYAAWHKSLDLSQQKQYWLNELKDMGEIAKIPADHMEKDGEKSEGESVTIMLSQSVTDSVKQFAKQQSVTEYMVFLSSFMILLSRYSRQEEVSVGTAVSGRTDQELEKMIGMFVNTVVIKGDIQRTDTFENIVKAMKEKTLKANENQDYPYEKLIELVTKSDEHSRSSLFNIMFSSEVDSMQELQLGQTKLRPIQIESENVKFDLMFSVNGMNDNYAVMLEYDTRLYKKESMERVGKQFISLMENLIKKPSEQIEKIGVLKSDEIQQLIEENLATNTEWPKDKSVLELFDEQVKRTPEKIALGTDQRRFTYLELNQRANQIAHLLIDLGVENEEFIGFIADKNSETVPIMLGILKAGAAYLPLDRKNPIERQEYILRDSQARIILTAEKADKNVYDSLATVVPISDSQLLDRSTENPGIQVSPDQLIYLMYTSGTTGNPKGTMIEHRNVVRLVKNTNYLNFENIRIAQTGSIAFDASTFEIWGALLNGGYVFLADPDVLMDGYLLETTIKEEKIDTIFMTVTLFNQMVLTRITAFDHLEHILVGGEKVSEKHIRLLKNKNKSIEFINIYGPTESTTFALFYPVEQEVPEEIPIGRPIANTTAYVFDGDQLSGFGIPGELYLGGAGLARGYLNQEEMTNDKFIDSPFQADERLYRTGDLVKLNEAHQIEYLGRIDNQVKLRGYRIELDEIKKALLELPKIVEAEVILKTVKESPLLCAYLSQDGGMTESQIDFELRKVLPTYMIPSVIIIMDKLPVNRNGKVDHPALPTPKINENQTQRQYSPPENDTQKIICGIFSDVLSVAKVGVDDNFFELGGDSIKAISIVSKLRAAGFEVSVMAIMSERTIRKIERKTKVITKASMIDQGMVTGKTILSPIQQLFFSKQLPKPNHFNQSFMFKSKEPIQKDKLQQTVNILIAHHDALRTRFDGTTQEVLAYQEDSNFLFDYHDLSEITNDDDVMTEIQRISTRAQETLNIETGELVNVQLFHTNDQDYLLMIVHHLVIDGVSWRILIEDFNTVYHALTTENQYLLPEKTTAFIHWTDALKEYSKSEEIIKERPYWQKIETSIKEAMPDENETHFLEQTFEEVEDDLSIALTRKLLYDSTFAYDTEINDLLLTAVSRAVSETIGTNAVSYSMESHGRRELGENKPLIDRTLGWFTSIYPVVFTGIGQTIAEDIEVVKKTLKEVPNQGLGYSLLQTYGELPLENIEPEITFNYLGDLESMSNQSNFLQIVKVRHGEDISEVNHFGTPLLINTVVIEGRLYIQMSFNQKRYKKELIDQLIKNIMTQLEVVILHCSKLKNERGANPLESFITSEYDRQSIYTSYSIEGEVCRLLFVENLTLEFYRTLQSALRKGKLVEVPDYFVDLDKYEDQLAFSTRSELEAFVRSPNMLETCTFAGFDFSDHEIEHKYPAATIQRKYLEQFNDTIVSHVLTIDGYYPKDKLINGVKEIIRTQPSLRSSYSQQENQMTIVEHAFSNEWPVTYVNNSYGEVLDPTNSSSLHTDSAMQVLSSITLVKVSEKRHQVHINASHSIWDKTSSTIIEQLLVQYLQHETTQTLEMHEGLRLYATNVEQRKNSNKNQKIVTDYQLASFSQLADQFLLENKENSLTQSEFVVLKLGKHLNEFYENNTWELLAYFMKIIAKESGMIKHQESKLPFYILQENRRYLGKQYLESLGAFLDCIPIVIDQEHSENDSKIHENVTQIQHLMSDMSVMDILEEEQPLPIDKLISINNQSAFGLTFDQFKDLQLLFEENEICSYEVLVNKYLNNLVLGVPKTMKNQRKMQQVLEEECSRLEEKLKKSE